MLLPLLLTVFGPQGPTEATPAGPLDALREWLPVSAKGAAVVVALVITRRLLDRAERTTSHHQLRNQLLMLGLTLVGLLVVILGLPIEHSTRSDILHLLGVVLSAAIALSSTTFLSNAMGALMLRAVRNFKLGDFVSVGEHFGRVTEQGLFHTEIQTEDRDLVTLPNMYLITNPMRVIRRSGTIVSCTVSLGYDAPRKHVEPLLIEAAGTAGLTDPFVQVTDLGDFAVTYRIAGLLSDATQIISFRSGLRKAVMDSLHVGGIEIVSPTFMNTRAYDPASPFIPRRVHGTSAEGTTDGGRPEELIFDKANEAEILTQGRQRLVQIDEKVQELKALAEAGGERGKQAKKHQQRLERRREVLEEEIKERAAKLDQAEG